MQLYSNYSEVKCLFAWVSDEKSFPDFIKMIMSEIPKRRLKKSWSDFHSVNPHWRPYVAQCLPCNIKYDYILKMETFSTDMP